MVTYKHSTLSNIYVKCLNTFLLLKQNRNTEIFHLIDTSLPSVRYDNLQRTNHQTTDSLGIYMIIPRDRCMILKIHRAFSIGCICVLSDIIVCLFTEYQNMLHYPRLWFNRPRLTNKIQKNIFLFFLPDLLEQQLKWKSLINAFDKNSQTISSQLQMY
jgi:hypothetical protein